MNAKPTRGSETTIDGVTCLVTKAIQLAGILHVYGVDEDGRTHHMIDACRYECAHRKPYTLSVTVTVSATAGAQTYAFVGRGSDPDYAEDDAAIHAFAYLGDDAIVNDAFVV